MIGACVRLATGKPKRVLVAAGVVFVVAVLLGAPVTGMLGSSSKDYQDPASQYERANAAIRAATKQQPLYNVAVLLRAGRDIRADARAQRATRTLATLFEPPRESWRPESLRGWANGKGQEVSGGGS